MKVFMAVDMEGITGTVYWPQPQLGGRDAKDDERQRKAMAEDVNAIAEGARRGGAKDFYVWDGHGAAPPRPNLLPADLDPAVYLYSGRFTRWMDMLDSTFDACILAGFHAYHGAIDILSHNFTNIREIWINSLRIGEIGHLALLAGAYGVPVVLVTGTEMACQEARELLRDVETVSTKKGYGHTLALCPPASKVREALAEGAERAMKRVREFKPFTLESPYRVEIEMGSGREPRKADVCCMFPFVERLSGTRIGYTCEDPVQALGLLLAMRLMAGSGPAA